MKALVLGVAATALALGAGGSVAKPRNGLIAFVSTRDGNRELYLMRADGTHQTNLSNTPGQNDGDPAWSPDGRRLAFTRFDPTLGPNVFVVAADGTGLEQITPGGGELPAWSPDGTRLAYVSPAGGIVVANADGSNAHVVVPAAGYRPSWSPDGRSIAYDDTRDSTRGIHVIDADGSNDRRLTRGLDTAAHWSPDGKQIVFSRDWQDLEVVAAKGGAVKPLDVRRANGFGGGSYGSWSPDGAKLVFVSNPFKWSGAEDIYTADADGTHPHELTTTGKDTEPSWQPVG